MLYSLLHIQSDYRRDTEYRVNSSEQGPAGNGNLRLHDYICHLSSAIHNGELFGHEHE